jgi:hypothetical protein
MEGTLAPTVSFAEFGRWLNLRCSEVILNAGNATTKKQSSLGLSYSQVHETSHKTCFTCSSCWPRPEILVTMRR